MGLLTDSVALLSVPGSNRAIREACAALPPAEAAVLRRTPYDPTAVAPLRAKILGEVCPSAETESQRPLERQGRPRTLSSGTLISHIAVGQRPYARARTKRGMLC